MKQIESEEAVGTPGLMMSKPLTEEELKERIRAVYEAQSAEKTEQLEAETADKKLHNNSKRRKMVAATEMLRRYHQAFERCEARDKDGHRCTKEPHPQGNHRAFGKEWAHD